jgi:hypothetical protein
VLAILAYSFSLLEMAAKRKNPQTVVLDPTLTEGADVVDTSPDSGEEVAYDDGTAALCPTCGELLAWHEERCQAVVMPLLASLVTGPEEVVATAPNPVLSGFTYAIGQPVQPAPTTQAGKVIWRGQVKERHPRTGLLHRVNVYRLDNGYWDCYYEAELQAAS